MPTTVASEALQAHGDPAELRVPEGMAVTLRPKLPYQRWTPYRIRWKRKAELMVQLRSRHAFMVRQCLVYPRFAYAAVRHRMVAVHHQPVLRSRAHTYTSYTQKHITVLGDPKAKA